MKGYFVAIGLAVACTAPLRADVTITQTMTVEGGAAAMSGSNMQTKMMTRIKGLKARADMDMAGTALITLVDLVRKEAYLLRPDQKTAMPLAAAPTAATPLKIDLTFKPTGQTRTIQNVSCDEYAIAMTMNMADMAPAQQASPEAAAMLEGARMVIKGSLWIAKSGPGSADYVTFQKASVEGGMASVLTGAFGRGANNMSRMMSAMAEAPGIPYLSELNMSVEGSGQMVEMMKQMGAMKVVTTLVAVSVDPIADDVFTMPADYKVVK